jgi:L-aminoadipate-semialdehyde dehydrogenase
MPLNPNGKIDKPALPFPDTTAAPRISKKSKTSSSSNQTPSMTPSETTIHDIWQRLLPSPPSPIPVEDNFFDLGGHSILATRLIFEIRKAFVVNAPLGLVFEQPTIKGLAGAIDALRQGDLGFANTSTNTSTSKPSGLTEDQKNSEDVSASGEDYAKDLAKFTKLLPSSFASLPSDFASKPLTIFLTGATGFLGAFVLRDLLERRGGAAKVKKVICLVRAKSAEQGMARLRDSGQGRAAWDEKWVEEGRVECVVGDLADEKFGLDAKTWERIAEEADSVVHNGALVSKLRLHHSSSATTHAFISFPFPRSTGSIPTPGFEPPTSPPPSPLSTSVPSTTPSPSPLSPPPPPLRPTISSELLNRPSRAATRRACPRRTTSRVRGRA